MYATKPILLLTSLVAGALANVIDTRELFGEGIEIAGVVVRDVNGVERMVDYNKVAHLIPRQDFCGTSTVYSCATGATASSPTAVVPVPVPVTSVTPGGPVESASSAASAPASAPASGSAPAATGSAAPGTSAPAATGSAASSAPATSASAASSTVAGATTVSQAPSSTGSVGAATATSALPTAAGIMVNGNMAAAAAVGFAVAAFI